MSSSAKGVPYSDSSLRYLSDSPTRSRMSLDDHQQNNSPGSSSTRGNGYYPDPRAMQGKRVLEDSRLSRASLACATCRARKIKCSGEKPTCSRCLKKSQTCIYPPLHKRRRESGRQTEEVESPSRISNSRTEATYPNPVPPPRPPSLPDDQRDTKTTTSHRPLTSPFQFAELTAPYPGQSSSLIASQIENPLATGVGLEFMNVPLPWQDNDMSASSSSLLLGNQSIDAFWSDLLAFDPAVNFGFSHHNTATSSSMLPIPSGDTSEVTFNASPSLGTKPNELFRVPYFRFFGPTAIAPGYKQVVCSESAPPSPTRTSNALYEFTSFSPLDQGLSTSGQDNQYPDLEVMQRLLPIFKLHYGYFFPFVQLSIIDQHLHPVDTPPYLVNIACALAARYSTLYGGQPNGAVETESAPLATRLANKAKEQATKKLAVASWEMVTTLLLISWYEFGQDRDGVSLFDLQPAFGPNFSQLVLTTSRYSGMGLRMGQDMGLDTLDDDAHLSSDTAIRPVNQHRFQLHCALRMMDAILTIGTGRSPMYRSLDVALPFFPPIRTLSGQDVPDPYPYLVRIFVLANRVTQILVHPDDPEISNHLELVQTTLNEFHTSLPPEVRFETSTFQVYAAASQGGAFVLIHLWFHTLIILSYNPSLLLSGPLPAALHESRTASKEVSASSAKTILDIAVFAELIDAKSISQPWINYPMYTAARTFLSLYTAEPAHTNVALSAAETHMAKTARANFRRVIGMLENLQRYWNGVRYIRSVLVQKADGVDHVTLVDNEEPAFTDIPPELAALWASKASSGKGDGTSPSIPLSLR
ncbi:hypothetical protein P7C73_g782, partial [Tremellales sp. Uapishka_1]